MKDTFVKIMTDDELRALKGNYHQIIFDTEGFNLLQLEGGKYVLNIDGES